MSRSLVGWNAVPVSFLVVSVLTVAAAMLVGYVFGRWRERGATARAFRNARKSLAELVALVGSRIDAAQDACDALERHPGLALTDEQARRLNHWQARLAETLGRISDHRSVSSSERSRPIEPFAIEWSCEPVDAVTGTPSREAFDGNLIALIAAGNRSGATSGLLLVKADKYESLQSRFGRAGAEKLLQRLGSVLCRTIRDEDLVCRFSADTFGVLLPNVGNESSRRMAETLRDAVRRHTFRIDASGPEVLVTASFGATLTRPDESAELALGRAADALAKSSNRGRNQLHIHDGERLLAGATA